MEQKPLAAAHSAPPAVPATWPAVPATSVQTWTDRSGYCPANGRMPGYIAYFQSHTNTYAPVEELRAKFTAALQHPDVIGIAIATRPDCLPPDVIDLLDELNQQTFLWVELGVQTIHPETSAAMNLCYCVSDYDDAVCRLQARGIRVVSHLILGLPGETEDMMFQSLEHVCQANPSD